jgi:hypothetical protein
MEVSCWHPADETTTTTQDAGETWADGADWMPTRLDVGGRCVWCGVYGGVWLLVWVSLARI